MTLTQQAQQIITAHFASNRTNNSQRNLGIAVDATCGNGHDTLFLLESGFAHVLGFDVQKKALQNTRELCKHLAESSAKLSLIHANHSELEVHVSKIIADQVETPPHNSHTLDCVMFNLGYLPSGEKRITTLAETTLRALNQACSCLAPGGLVTVLCYPGHPQGLQETTAVITKLNTLANTKQFILKRYDSIQPSETTPILFALYKTTN